MYLQVSPLTHVSLSKNLKHLGVAVKQRMDQVAFPTQMGTHKFGTHTRRQACKKGACGWGGVVGGGGCSSSSLPDHPDVFPSTPTLQAEATRVAQSPGCLLYRHPPLGWLPTCVGCFNHLGWDVCPMCVSSGWGRMEDGDR